MSQAATKFLTGLDREIIRFAPFAILVFDEQNRVKVANAEAVTILSDNFGCSDIVGKGLEAIFPEVEFSNIETEALSRISTQGKHHPLELQCVKIETDGSLETLVFLSQTDVQRQRELILEREASTDELSGLSNRRAFQRTMESNHHLSLSLAIVDIDQFKTVNDVHGHLAGDDVIQHVGYLLRESFTNDAIVVARMGGDEFSVLFETKNTNEIVAGLDNFRETIFNSNLPQIDGIQLSVSVGAALSSQASIGARRCLPRQINSFTRPRTRDEIVSPMFCWTSERI